MWVFLSLSSSLIPGGQDVNWHLLPFTTNGSQISTFRWEDTLYYGCISHLGYVPDVSTSACPELDIPWLVSNLHSWSLLFPASTKWGNICPIAHAQPGGHLWNHPSHSPTVCNLVKMPLTLNLSQAYVLFSLSHCYHLSPCGIISCILTAVNSYIAFLFTERNLVNITKMGLYQRS